MCQNAAGVEPGVGESPKVIFTTVTEIRHRLCRALLNIEIRMSNLRTE